jgi:hypothetical protein
MKNPTVEQVNFVIDRLQFVRYRANKKDAFDITEDRVYNKEDNYKCGTVHCIGGWYVVANFRRGAIRAKRMEGLINYADGADLMATDLGFADRYDLRDWARDNPKIWNNDNGYLMFSNTGAYDSPGFDGVIAQFETVRDNLPEAA